MGPSSAGVTVRKPVSVWNREVHFEPRVFFKALGDAASEAADTKWGSAVKKCLEALTLGEFKNKPERLAYILVLRSLLWAAAELVLEVRGHLKPVSQADLDSLDKKLAKEFEKLEFTLHDDFLASPGDLPFLKDMAPIIQEWLTAHGVDEARASAATARLRTLFAVALDEEWRAHSAEYASLADRFRSPFTPAANMARAWISYQARLEAQAEEPLFGFETFNVTQVHVPLRAWYLEEVKSKEDEPFSLGRPRQNEAPETKRAVVWLRDQIQIWLDSGDPSDGLRVIAGDPGSGKSTEAKLLAADPAVWQNFRVLFVPLHRFTISGDFIESVGRFVQNVGLFPKNPLKEESAKPLLIILDALDELPLTARSAIQNAKEFVAQINRHLDNFSRDSRRVLVLLSGRTVVMDACRSELKKTSQVLHLLPYFLIEREIDQYQAPEGMLDHDQRHDWWIQYGGVIGRKYVGLPGELRKAGRRLDHLTSQPLFNYLVALSLEGGLKVDENTNLSQIYDHLIHEVFKGIHNANRDNPMIAELGEEDFIEVLEEISISAWHYGQGKTAGFGDIVKRCEKCGLEPILKILSEEAGTGLMQIMTAFYFRLDNRPAAGREMVEFTHKSFQEHLTARRIMRTLQEWGEVYSDKKSRRRFDFDDELRRWAELCGPAVMDEDLFEFLKDRVKLMGESKPSMVGFIQEAAQDLFGHMLREGMPMHRLGLPTFMAMARQAVNSEIALLAGINSCSRVTGKLVEIDWGDKRGFASWFKKIEAYCTTSSEFIKKCCLKNIDLSKTILTKLSLDYSNLEGARLCKIKLSTMHVDTRKRIGFLFCNSASLRLACLSRADLQHADLKGADFQWANLEGANLTGADLQEANLKGASLTMTNLTGANLTGADLQEVNLQRAILTRADLQWADLKGANLTGVDLQGIILRGTNLIAANLKKIKNITPEQLAQTKSLYRAKLDTELTAFLREAHPQLFEAPYHKYLD